MHATAAGGIRDGGAAQRAVLETVAVWAKALGKAERFLAERNFDEYDRLIAQVFFGTKDAERKVSNLEPISVLNAMDSLDKVFPGVRRTYDELSEVAHPNGEGLMFLHTYDDGLDVTFDPREFTQSLLANVLRGLRLDIAENCVAVSDRLIALVAETWHRERGGAPSSAE